MKTVCLAALIAVCIYGCAGPSTPRVRNMPPNVKIGRLIHDPAAQAPNAATIKRIQASLESLVQMVFLKDWRGLPAMVSKTRGIYVDLKGFRSHAELTGDVNDRSSYIYTFYHDTERLRTATRDPGQVCVRDVLLYTSSITVDVFMEEGNREVELELHVDDAPKESYRLNHPVFILEDGEWKVFRLF